MTTTQPAMRAEPAEVTRHGLRTAVVMTAGTIAIVVALLVVVGAPEALAATGVAAPPKDLNTVIDNIRNWVMGVLVALATLFFTIGAVRFLLAGGDPGEVAKAKDTFKYAAIGYGVAVLAPVLVQILKGFVGG